MLSSSIFTRPTTPPPTVTTKSYAQRAELSKNELARIIFNLMETKKTNLTLSADVNTAEKLLELADNIGPEICVLKIHHDIVKDFNLNVVAKLKELAKEHSFIIFEDRKFAEIGKIAKDQYSEGPFEIAKWATLVNAHAVPGDGVVMGLKAGAVKGNGLLLVAQMSSAGNLIDAAYTKKVVAMAEEHNDFVVGFISQETISSNESFINFTPGIQYGAAGDALKQTYHTPEKAFAAGTDSIIVGSGICSAKNAKGDVTPESQKAAAQLYRKNGWNAYLARTVEVKQENVSAISMSMNSTGN